MKSPSRQLAKPKQEITLCLKPARTHPARGQNVCPIISQTVGDAIEVLPLKFPYPDKAYQRKLKDIRKRLT